MNGVGGLLSKPWRGGGGSGTPEKEMSLLSSNKSEGRQTPPTVKLPSISSTPTISVDVPESGMGTPLGELADKDLEDLHSSIGVKQGKPRRRSVGEKAG